MSFQAKLDWQYGETPTENDANRWEQGIKDANDATTNLTPRVKTLETEVQAIKSALANDLRDNQFAFDFLSTVGLKIDAGWLDKTNAQMVIK